MIFSRDYENEFKKLLDNYCLFLVDVEFVDNVREWCRENGIDERDKEKPLKLIVREGDKGCKMVVRTEIPKKVVQERINALEVRSALTNVAKNKADMLDSEKKKLAYLFLSEYAATLPGMEDEIIADDWTFKEMEKLNYFNE
jgi:hypothetical protein